MGLSLNEWLLLLALGWSGPASAAPEPALLSRSAACNPHVPADPGPGVEHHQVGGNGTTYWPYQIFKSANFNPPVWEINATGEPLAPGLIFVSPSNFGDGGATSKQPAPQIFTDKGQLVWSGPAASATNLKWQYLDGEPALTFGVGISTAAGNIGHGYGNVTILDSSYRVKHVICPDFGLTIPGNETVRCQADLHESYLTDRNTIFLTAYNATPADLTSLNGSANGWVFDCLFFELDPHTGKTLFKWSALDHVSVSDSHQPLTGAADASSPFDFFHINSVVNIGDYYLVNSRHTWTIYLLNSKGDIIWRFNGQTGGDLGALPDGGTFRWQHFARPHNVTNTTFDLSIFNNNNQAADNSTLHPTNNLVYHLPLKPTNETKPVLRRKLENSPALFADSQGSYIADLPNGNQFTTFGQLPLVKEYGPASDGSDVRWTGRVGPDNAVQIYRGYKQEWHATPSTLPSLVVLASNSSTNAGYFGYVSWNGATDVTGWNVYLGRDASHLHRVGTAGYRGFETRFDVACWAEYVQVGAVVNGTEVKRSEAVSTK